MQIATRATLIALICGVSFGQNAADMPRIEIADVHVTPAPPPGAQPLTRMQPPNRGRYELRGVTMADLIRLGWDTPVDRIIGGPNWLELDRFDVIAKVPQDATQQSLAPALQALLKERFDVKLHEDTRPLMGWALMAGKNPKLKEANGSEDSGCIPQNSAPPAGGRGGGSIGIPDAKGQPQQITLGAGATIQFSCRNMSMADLAAYLPKLPLANMGASQVTDETGLKGKWNFDLKWSLVIALPGSDIPDHVTFMDAIEKQLGLKLEQKQIPQKVLVVDSVNRKPTANSPEVAKELPSTELPKEFEVADLKLSNPDARQMNFRMQPGGRLLVEGLPVRLLLSLSFSGTSINTTDGVVGLPGFADTLRLDITAKTPPDVVTGPGLDPQVVGPMIISLLKERLKFAYHMEDRPVSTYKLVAAKPKMKKADPDSRIFCRNESVPGAPNPNRTLHCQNASMALLAERLRGAAQGLSWPISDETGLEGGYDFTFTFSQLANLRAPVRAPDGAAPGDLPSASDPSGGYSVFEAIEKQLGLKLESVKKPMPVMVVDHLESKPVDN